jgi:hypothetical protein
MIPATRPRHQTVGGQQQEKQETQFQQFFRKMSSNVMHIIVTGEHTVIVEERPKKEKLQILVKPNLFGPFEVKGGDHITENMKQVFAFTNGLDGTSTVKKALGMPSYERERVIMIDGQLYNVYTDNERQFTFSPGTAEAAAKINELLDDLMEGSQ